MIDTEDSIGPRSFARTATINDTATARSISTTLQVANPAAQRNNRTEFLRSSLQKATMLPMWIGEAHKLTPTQEAAILVECSKNAQDLDLTHLSSRSRTAYRVRRKFRALFRIAAWSMVLIHIFQRPLWTLRVSDNAWDDTQLYPSYGLPYMTYGASTALITVLVLVLWVLVALELSYRTDLRHNWLLLLLVLALALKTVDLLIAYVALSIDSAPIFTTSPVEVVFLLLVEDSFENNLGYIGRALPRFTMLMLVLATLICTYAALGLLVFNPASQEALQWFPNYGRSVWNMLMVLNGSNWPTPMLPALDDDTLYAFYFVLYIVLLGWGLLNLVTGFVYAIFKIEQTNISYQQADITKQLLTRAFTTLDVEEKGFLSYSQVDALLTELYMFYNESSTTKAPTSVERYELTMELDQTHSGIVDEREFCFINERCLGIALKRLRANKIKYNRYKRSAKKLWNSNLSYFISEPTPGVAVDDNILHDGDVSDTASEVGAYPAQDNNNILHQIYNQQRQHHFPNLMNIGSDIDPQFSRSVTETSFASSHPTATDSADRAFNPSIIAQHRMVAKKHPLRKLFSMIATYVDRFEFDCAADTGVAFVGVLYISGVRNNGVVFTYLALSMFENFLKVLVKGLFRFLRSYRNLSDSIMTLILVIILGERSTNGYAADYIDNYGIRALIILRILLFPRNFFASKSFRTFRRRNRFAFEYAFKGANYFTFLFVLLLSMLYAFAALGMQLFGGVIRTDGNNGQKLAESLYGESGYYPLNFNDMLSGMATMFILLSVNNMHVTASGFTAVTSQWAQLFFALWYVIGVLFLLNVLTAAFLSQFTGYLEKLAEMRQELSAIISSMETTADHAEAGSLMHSDRDEQLALYKNASDTDSVNADAIVLRSSTANPMLRKFAASSSVVTPLSPPSSADVAVAATMNEFHEHATNRVGWNSPGFTLENDRSSRMSSTTVSDAERGSAAWSLALNPLASLFRPSRSSTLTRENVARNDNNQHQHQPKEVVETPTFVRSGLSPVGRGNRGLSIGNDKLLQLLNESPRPRRSSSIKQMDMSPASFAAAQDSLRENRYGPSIFASNSGRRQLDEWVLNTYNRTRANSMRRNTLVERNTISSSPSGYNRAQSPVHDAAREAHKKAIARTPVDQQLKTQLLDAGDNEPSQGDDKRAQSETLSPLQPYISKSNSSDAHSPHGSAELLSAPKPDSNTSPRNRRKLFIHNDSLIDTYNPDDSAIDLDSDILVDLEFNAHYQPSDDANRTTSVGSSKAGGLRDRRTRSRSRAWTKDNTIDEADSANSVDVNVLKNLAKKGLQIGMVVSKDDDDLHTLTLSQNKSNPDLISEVSTPIDSSRMTTVSDKENLAESANAVLSELQHAVDGTDLPETTDTEAGVDEDYDPEEDNQQRVESNTTTSKQNVQYIDDPALSSSDAPSVDGWNNRVRSFFGIDTAAKNRRNTSMRAWMYGDDNIPVHEKAAVLIQFARDGEEHTMFVGTRALLFYKLRAKLSYLFRGASFIFVLLRFFERPLWTFRRDNWSDQSLYPRSGLPLADPDVMVGLKLPLILILMVGLVLEIGYKESTEFNPWSLLSASRMGRYTLLCYCIAQFLMLLYYACSGDQPELVTIASAGSLAYLLWFNRKSLQKLKLVLRIVPRLSLALLVFLLLILTLAGLGPFVFDIKDASANNDDSTIDYFGSYSEAVWSVFVAITSSDYPNQIMPSYAQYREVIIFDFLFICLGAFFMLNVIIIIVLVEFQKASQLAADVQKASREVLLIRAFEILDRDDKGYVDKKLVKLLLDELYIHYSDFNKAGIPKGAAKNILIDILDVDGDGKISIDDFLFFLDVTRIKIVLDTRRTFFEVWFPEASKSDEFAQFKTVVAHRYFEVTTDIIAFTLIAATLVNDRKHVYQASTESVGLTIGIILLFLLEAAVKMCARGYRNYFRALRNRVDIVITAALLLVFIAALINNSFLDQDTGAAQNVDGLAVMVRVLLMCRLILLPRNLHHIFVNQGGPKITRLLRRIFIKIYTLGIIFFCTGYFFASIGVFSYGGLVSTSGEDYEQLADSPYGLNGFYDLNFNDFGNAFIALFVCLHVSDFDVVTSGFVSVTSRYSRLYFTTWYVVGVLLMLNILKSFFLGEFLFFFAVTHKQKTGGQPVSMSPTSKKFGASPQPDNDKDSITGRESEASDRQERLSTRSARSSTSMTLKNRLLNSMNDLSVYDPESKTGQSRKKKSSGNVSPKNGNNDSSKSGKEDLYLNKAISRSATSLNEMDYRIDLDSYQDYQERKVRTKTATAQPSARAEMLLHHHRKPAADNDAIASTNSSAVLPAPRKTSRKVNASAVDALNEEGIEMELSTSSLHESTIEPDEAITARSESTVLDAPRYHASMDFVKDLDPKSKDMLKTRMMNLAKPAPNSNTNTIDTGSNHSQDEI